MDASDRSFFNGFQLSVFGFGLWSTMLYSNSTQQRLPVLITAKNICKNYGSGSNLVCALEQLDFEIAAGEKVAIVGQSGSGKTTLLNILSGLDKPTDGELLIDGKDLGKLSSSEMADYRLETVGVIFQSFQLIPQRTAAQNVEMPLIIAGKSVRDRKVQVAEALAQVGLNDRAGHYPYQLSGGEQQRVAIARATINNPKVLLADEPTGNLDSKTSKLIMDLISRVAQERSLTFLLITHDLELAASNSKNQFVMNDGRLSPIELSRTMGLSS